MDKAQAALKARKDFTRQLTVLILGAVLFCAILLMPQPDGMTVPAQKLLATVALMAFWWMGGGISISVTALLPLILFPALGIMSSQQVAPNYTNHLVFLFLGGFMIALSMEKWNFHKRLAVWCISAIGTNPQKIVLSFMVASAFLSMWISNTATTMMMLPVAMAVVRQVSVGASIDGKKSDNTDAEVQKSLGLTLMLGLAYAASIGGVGTLIGTPANIVFSGFFSNLYPEREPVSFFRWMLFAVPLVCIFLPLVWLYLCRFAAPVSVGRIQMHTTISSVMSEELTAMGKLSRPEKIIGSIFAGTALLWTFRSPIDLGAFTIPGWAEAFPQPGHIQDATVAMAMGILLMLLPVSLKKGIQLGDRREYFLLDWQTVQDRVPWGILLLFGGGFSLAAGFAETGLDKWIGIHLNSLGVLPVAGAILLTCLFITFLTELTSNTATLTMILPIIGAVAVASGFDPLFLMVPATLSASFAFMLPVATPPNTIVYGSGWVSVSEMTRAGFALNLIGVVLITTALLLIIRLGVF
ncbi:SLC13 family permease [Kordiimonas sp.]|uniref:SLC13 family permease n=1 Tax=Kordiimonas sp. TaxID=1970157 RepID=UPI003A914D33